MLVVYGGEANEGLVGEGGYFHYTDVATSELLTWSVDPVLLGPDGEVVVLSNGAAGGFGSPDDMGGFVRSFASIPGVMDVTADTSLIGGTARTDFTFTPADEQNLPAGWRFLFYVENDLFDFANDATDFTGSIAGGDLVLYQYDSGLGGLTATLSGAAGAGAELIAFGAGIWPGWGEDLESGDLSSLSADGSTFEFGPADLGFALLFDLTFASPATLTVNYGTQPQPPGVPEPGALALVGAGLLAMRRWRRNGPNILRA
jgi:MYXO-CTERM domain-containing protein